MGNVTDTPVIPIKLQQIYHDLLLTLLNKTESRYYNTHMYNPYHCITAVKMVPHTEKDRIIGLERTH